MSVSKKSHAKPGYWKYWYWNKGGRDKVQKWRKVTAPKNYEIKKAKQYEEAVRRTGFVPVREHGASDDVQDCH